MGVYNSKNYYKDGTYYLFAFNSNTWMISGSLGSTSGGDWYVNSTANTPPSTSSWNAQNGVSGTLTTSSGAGSNLTVDNAGDMTDRWSSDRTGFRQQLVCRKRRDWNHVSWNQPRRAGQRRLRRKSNRD